MNCSFYERCSLITATVCAYKLNNARKRVMKNYLAHTVEVVRLRFSKKSNPVLIFSFNNFSHNALLILFI